MLKCLVTVASIVCAVAVVVCSARAHDEALNLLPIAHTATLFSQPMPEITPGITGKKLMHVASGDVEALQISHVGKHLHSIKDELLYVVAGKGTVVIADRVYALNPGDIVAIRHQTPHEIMPSGGTMSVILIAYPEDEQKDWVGL